MIRWTYLIPRLVVIVAAVSLLGFGLSPLVRWALVRYGSQALGARIDLAALDVSLWQTGVTVAQLAVTNPSSPMRNLFQIDQGTFQLDRDALLERRFVVCEGSIRGLRFDTLRDASGAIAAAEPPPEDTAGFSFPQVTPEWLEAFAGQIGQDLESELMTPGLCRELARRYPQEYDQLKRRVAAMQQRIKQLQVSVQELRRNPLQDPRVYEDLLRQVDDARQQLAEVQPELTRLRGMLQSDRAAVHQARQHDVAYVRERLQWQSLDAESLSQYLLGSEQTARIQSTLAWIRLVRSYIPTRQTLQQPERGRGRIVQLPGWKRGPSLLFEQLAIDGCVDHDGQTVPFAGTLCGLTHQPGLYGQPATLCVEAGTETPVQIQAVVDRTGAVAHDRIVVSCPGLQLPPRQLGKDAALAVAVSPGPGSLRLELELHDDALTGQLVLDQSRLDLEARLADAYGGRQLQDRLNQSLDHVDDFRVTIDLAGTLRRPRCQLHSDLGRQLADGFQLAFRQELDDRAERIAARLDAQVQQQLDRLQQLVDQRSEELLAGLDAPRREIEQLMAPVNEQLGALQQFQLPAIPRTGSLPLRNWLPR
jgi:uncharacterized protein (TIGR03545 family)